MKIGFIGTGVMGASMIRNLLKNGYEVSVFSRTKEKADYLVEEGATWQHSIAELSAHSDVVITMVGYPNDVEEVYLSKEGIIENAKEGTFLIDMTTSTPTLAREIYESAKQRKILSLDAPVSGGDIGAKNATLSIMVGGDETAYLNCIPIFQVMGSNIIYQGGAGTGQHTKMCNQIAIACNMIGVCEALAYAKKSGLIVDNVLKSIQSGAAGSWSLSNLAPRMMKNDYAPGFFVKHFIKDLKIAIDEAKKMEIQLPGLQLAEKLYSQLSENGSENEGTQALIKLYQ